MIKTLLSLIVLLVVTSCTLFESFSKGDVVARIGNTVLYKSDVEKVMPRGASAADSASFVGRYIDSWALKQLMYEMAQKQLPKSEKDVETLLNEYKAQLLVFRYENKYIEERLDTVITESEKRSYYQEHVESFVTKDGVVRGCFVKMHNSSPNLQMIKALCVKNDSGSLDRLSEMAYNSAYKFDNYENMWVDMSIVARDMEVEISELLEDVGKRRYAESKDSAYTRFLRVVEFVLPGEVSPYEHNEEHISEIILSKRKQDLLSTLYKDIYNDAVKSNKIEIINEEDN